MNTTTVQNEDIDKRKDKDDQTMNYTTTVSLRYQRK